MLVDLHIHTNYSDGTMSPQELVEHAVHSGLSTIAITDHDVIDAYAIAKEHIDEHQLPLSLIPGVEFNTNESNREVHILGYYIDTKHPQLAAAMLELQAARVDRIQQIVDKLQPLNYEINMQDVFAETRNVLSLGRPHVARVLVKKGYFKQNREVFDALLAKGQPAYVPHVKISVAQAVKLIIAAGGVPVLAHPGLIKDDECVQRLLDNNDIRGLEVYYPTHTARDILKYLEIAKSRSLICTGGSDFHATLGRYPQKLGIFSLYSKQICDIINYYK